MGGSLPFLVLLMLSVSTQLTSGVFHAFFENVAGIWNELGNFGSTIRKEVSENLKPFYDLVPKVKIRNGNGPGGTTVASFEDKTLVIRKSIFYECEGDISDDGSCSGTLSKLKLDEKKDFCYLNINNIINNWYCLANGNAVAFIRGWKYQCTSPDSKTLLISKNEYQELCKDQDTVTYKFVTNDNSTDFGPDINCSDNEVRVCSWKEQRSSGNTPFMGSYQYFSNW